MVIVGRIVQAPGASVIPAIAMIVPVRYFSAESRGRALGTVAIGFSLGLAMGPIIAGVVSSTWNWRVLFVISLLSLLTLPMYRKYLDEEKGVARKIDFIGGLLLAGTVAILLLALTNGSIWLALVGTITLIFSYYVYDTLRRHSLTRLYFETNLYIRSNYYFRNDRD